MGPLLTWHNTIWPTESSRCRRFLQREASQQPLVLPTLHHIFNGIEIHYLNRLTNLVGERLKVVRQ